MRKFLTLFLALLALTTPSALFGQALADRVPADAIVYIGWKGGDTPGTGYEGSHLQAVLKDANLKAILDDVVPQVINKISDNDPTGTEKFTVLRSIARPLWRHPTAIFLQPPTEANTPPRVGVICNAGADGRALQKQLNDLLAQAGADAQEHVKVAESGDLVVIHIGMPGTNAALPAPDGDTLSKDPGFAAALKQTLSDPFVMGYVNVEAGLALIDRAVAESNQEQPAQIWSRVREASGFAGLKRIAVGGKFDGKDWSTAAFVEAPAPRKGLVAVFETKPIGPDVMSMIPASAAMAQVTRFDFAALVKEIRNVVAAADPNAATMFDQGVGAAQMMIGKNPITDVLEPLGDTWVMYSDANVAGNKLEGVVIVNKLDDPAKAQQGLTSAWFAASNMVNSMMQPRRRGGQQPQQPPPPAPVSLTQEKVGDLTVSFLNTPVHGMGWTISDGKLIIGFSKDGITKAAAAPAPSQGFDQNPKYAALAKKLAGGEVTSFKFADLPVTAPVMYEQMTQGLAALRAMAQQQGIVLPEKILPPLETVKAHVAPAASVSWIDANGFHAKSFKPFPGSDVFSNAPNTGMAQLGSGALAMGALLPAMNRSREVSNRVKCASNQRQIGQAILLYSNDNKGKYPPDLGTLILTQEISYHVFICPSGGTNPPPNVRAMTPQQIADWVNKNADYVYVGQGLNNNAPPDQVVLYEKQDAHRKDGMNMLYGDGHVEFHVQRQAEQLINTLKNKPAAP